MFGKNYFDMSQIRTTSRVALKLSCLQACGNDIDKAERLYAYIADGISDIPDVDAVAPSGLERVKSGADDVLGWLSSHRDEISQGVALLQSLRSKANSTVASVATLPEIPKP